MWTDNTPKTGEQHLEGLLRDFWGVMIEAGRR